VGVFEESRDEVKKSKCEEVKKSRYEEVKKSKSLKWGVPDRRSSPQCPSTPCFSTLFVVSVKNLPVSPGSMIGVLSGKTLRLVKMGRGPSQHRSGWGEWGFTH
jgi:hypothetical protein